MVKRYFKIVEKDKTIHKLWIPYREPKNKQNENKGYPEIITPGEYTLDVIRENIEQEAFDIHRLPQEGNFLFVDVKGAPIERLEEPDYYVSELSRRDDCCDINCKARYEEAKKIRIIRKNLNKCVFLHQFESFLREFFCMS